MASQNERRIATEILKTVRRLDLPLKLDTITEGKGNCFPLSILAQCKRSEIFRELNVSVQALIVKNDPTLLRHAVYSFIAKSRHPTIQAYKDRYEKVLSVIDQKNWEEYWNIMIRNYEWVDYIFIQSTAWYLKHDIIIVTTSSTQQHPYMTISGNLDDCNIPCPGIELTIGSKSQVHYQSLLPLTVKIEKRQVQFEVPEDTINLKLLTSANSYPTSTSRLEKEYTVNLPDISSKVEFPDLNYVKGSQPPKLITVKANERKPFTRKDICQKGKGSDEQSNEAKEHKADSRNEDKKMLFKYEYEGETFEFEFITESRIKCSNCKMAFKNILRHLQQSKCKVTNLDLFSQKFQEFKKVTFAEKYQQKQNERKIKSREKQRKEDAEKVKNDQNKWKGKSLNKQREEDGQRVKDGQNERKRKSQAKQREEDSQKVKDGHNEIQRKSLAKQRLEDSKKVKDDQNERKRISLEKQRIEDAQKVKHDQNERKRISLEKQRIEDAQKVKHDQNKWKKLSRNKHKLEDPSGLTKHENQMNIKRRKSWNASDRLREFLESTKYNAIFICSCCHRRLFISNVEIINEKLKNKINEKKAHHFEECIEECIITPINGRSDAYICKTCINHLMKQKIPPMAATNDLKLYPQDPNTQLTELEGALISKNLIFQKIYQLPKSRWSALKDRIINVPIDDEDILNTVELLPRTPKEAGLIGVSLKRKMEYKNTHKRQLVNPKKIWSMLNNLKKAGNPYYQFYEDLNAYEERCKMTDPEGHEVIFPSDDELEEDIDKLPKETSLDVLDEVMKETSIKDEEIDSDDQLDSDDDSDEKDEKEYLTKDPIRKYQFTYNESVCLANKYPEVDALDPTKDIEIAPGEGHIPNNIMNDKDWDIKAFPHLHNTDGSNGKDTERKERLTEQSYFIQRITNKDKRFAQSPAYIYAAVAYLEKKQLQRNINISGTRGKRVEGSDGGITYELEDGYTVLDDIKNTPRYWKKAKYEMLAKLENLGSFQFFFTLSCADMRWKENFAAILRDKGLNLHYSVIPDHHGHYSTKIEVEFHKDGKLLKKDIMTYLKEEADESLHEIIRGNVLLATRYFNYRVKKFMDTVVLGDNNPMMVEYFTYKVEFQQRGAGHIHGTLWLNLHKMERLVRTENGQLILDAEVMEEEMKIEQEQTADNDKKRPFWGISSTFKKLKNNEELSIQEKDALKNFIDEFTTVCTNENIVGERVSKIVLEVNLHSHTKSCRKYDCPCRFFFPRFPSSRTIIVGPLRGVKQEERKERLKTYEKNLEKVKLILEDPDIVEELIESVGRSEKEPLEVYKVNRERRIEALVAKAGITIEEYEEALSYTDTGYKVVIQRDLTEIFINSYNIEWIEAWDGNMDMQPTFDYHATITYITDYFAKDDTGLMELINSVLKQEKTADTKERMKTVANTFLTHRQIGEAEAVYRLIPNMVLKNSNVSCQWLSVGKRSEISKRWKLATKQEMEVMEEGLIKIKDREGLWFQQQDMLSKFLRRSTNIEVICPVQFSKMFTTSGLRLTKKMKKYLEEIEEEDNGEEIEERELNECDLDDSHFEQNSRKFHYIMVEGDEKIKLPDVIEINNPYPGEPKYMRKRKSPAVIRYHKGHKDKDYEGWMLKELMLYTHFRECDLDEYENNTAKVYKEKETWIQSVKSQVMEHLESVEEARYMVELAQKEIDSEQIAVQMDAAFEQDQDECNDEGEHLHPDYHHLDTEGIEQNGNSSNAGTIFKKIVIPPLNELREETRKLDKFQREALNIAVKYAKDIVKSRRDGNSAPRPIYLIGHGGAGAGKSTVIHLVSRWCQKILAQEGDDPGCPYIIKTAFTGTAASIIEGQTLHTSFSFNFDHKHYSLSDKKRDEKRALFRNLRIIIIDEVSMVKADMLYQLDLKLQELKERTNIPFGGVSILAFGDILQLRPVLGRFAFEKPNNPEFHATYILNNRWELFSVLNLEVNHRQGEDREYADTLNRSRVGKMSEDDILKLKERVRPRKHEDLKNASLYIVPTRDRCAKYNKIFLDSVEGEEIELNARHYHATQKKYKPFIEKKDGTIGTTGFEDKLKLKIGAKIILIHNIDTSDGLTNGQFGELVGVIKSKDGDIDKLVVKPLRKDAGVQNRRKFPGLTKKYPECVIIERVSVNYPIRKRGGAVGSTATLVQFPVKLAFAITSHKIQGQTIPKPLKVVYDINSIFEEAQGYVMLSRVQTLNQIYIIDKFAPEKIYPSKKALIELERMNRISINENPDSWECQNEGSVKIASLNCQGLRAHFPDIRTDDKLLMGDIIHLSETSIKKEDNIEEFDLEGYAKAFINIQNGKGIATYYNERKITLVTEVKKEKFQIIKFKTTDLDIINIYRSQTGHSVELLEDLENIIQPKRTTIITGDFNICYMENFNNRLIQGLLKMGFDQRVHEPTHIRGRIIDQVYYIDPDNRMNTVIKRYSPYYSDHDAILVSLNKEESN